MTFKLNIAKYISPKTKYVLVNHASLTSFCFRKQKVILTDNAHSNIIYVRLNTSVQSHTPSYS